MRTTDHFIRNVPRHMCRSLNMRGAIQAQNDEIGFECVRGQQDLLTRVPELDIEFRLDGEWRILQNQFLQPSLAMHSGIVSHLCQITRF